MRFLYGSAGLPLENICPEMPPRRSRGCDADRKASAVSVKQEHPMMDVVMIAFGVGLVLLTIGYAYACDRL
jgi:hypothetical protein